MKKGSTHDMVREPRFWASSSRSCNWCGLSPSPVRQMGTERVSNASNSTFKCCSLVDVWTQSPSVCNGLFPTASTVFPRQANRIFFCTHFKVDILYIAQSRESFSYGRGEGSVAEGKHRSAAQFPQRFFHGFSPNQMGRGFYFLNMATNISLTSERFTAKGQIELADPPQKLGRSKPNADEILRVSTGGFAETSSRMAVEGLATSSQMLIQLFRPSVTQSFAENARPA